MKKLNKWIIGGVAALAVAGTAAAYGHRHFHDPAARAEYISSMINHDLDLNEQQAQKLNSARDTIVQVFEDGKEHRSARHQELLGLLDQTTLDRGRILAILAEETQRINDKAPEVVTAIGDFYDSLTPDQQSKLKTEIQQHADHHHRWHDE